jgi:hypothetical protein
MRSLFMQTAVNEVDGVVAQLVERLVRNEKVAGSIPVGSTIQPMDYASSKAVGNPDGSK